MINRISWLRSISFWRVDDIILLRMIVKTKVPDIDKISINQIYSDSWRACDFVIFPFEYLWLIVSIQEFI